MSCKTQESCPGTIIIAGLVGAAIGAVTALLLAPKPGYELRANIGETGRAFNERARDMACQAREKANVLAEKLKSFKGDQA